MALGRLGGQLALVQVELCVAKNLLADEVVLVKALLPLVLDLRFVKLAQGLVVIVLLFVVLEAEQHLAFGDLVPFLDEQLDGRVARAGLDLHLDLGLKRGGALED